MFLAVASNRIRTLPIGIPSVADRSSAAAPVTIEAAKLVPRAEPDRAPGSGPTAGSPGAASEIVLPKFVKGASVSLLRVDATHSTPGPDWPTDAGRTNRSRQCPSPSRRFQTLSILSGIS